jgi:hypothetical protein
MNTVITSNTSIDKESGQGDMGNEDLQKDLSEQDIKTS